MFAGLQFETNLGKYFFGFWIGTLYYIRIKCRNDSIRFRTNDKGTESHNEIIIVFALVDCGSYVGESAVELQSLALQANLA